MRWSGAILILLAACSINPRWAVPPEVSEGDALVFLVHQDGTDPVVFATQVDDADIVLPLQLSTDATVRTELAVYDDTELASLWLPSGFVETDESGDALPPPDVHYAIRSEGPPEGAAFEVYAWDGSSLAAQKFARSALDCLEQRRCLTPEAAQCVACDDDVDVTPPTPPEPPRAICPTGWARTAIDGTNPPVEICDPRSPVDRFDCPPGEVRKLGATECRRVGRACPTTGRFADTEGIFVDSAADPGGDGTFAAPFSSLRDALAAARAGDVILLSTGVHAIATTVANALGTDDRPVTVRGACVTGTRLSVAPYLLAEHSALRFEDLELVVEDRFWNGLGGSLELDGVVVRADGVIAPIRGAAARIEIHDALVDSMGSFIEASTSSVVVEDSVLSARTGPVLVNQGGLRTTVRDSVLTSGAPDLPVVQIDRGGVVSLVRVSFEDAVSTGVVFEGAAGLAIVDVFFAAADDARLDDTHAIDVRQGAVSIERLWIQGALGMSCDHADIDANDVVIAPDADTRLPEPLAPILLEHVSGSLERVVVTESRGHAIRTASSTVSLYDLRIEDVRRVEDTSGMLDVERSVGVLVTGESQTDLQRASFRAIEGAAIAHSAPLRTGQMIIADLDVRESGPVECDSSDAGVIAGPNDAVTRARFASMSGTALSLEATGTVHATDIAITNVAARSSCSALRGAIAISGNAQIVLSTFTIDGVDGAGIHVAPSLPVMPARTPLAANHGRIRDVEVGVRYLIGQPRPEALVDVRIDPRPNRFAIE